MKNKIQFMCLLGLFMLYASASYAQEIKVFQQDSYQQILAEHKNKPLVLIIWSVTCSSCLAEMPLIQTMQQQYDQVDFVMLSVDGPEFNEQMHAILKQEKLTEIEQWGFVEDNSSALRYIIDNSWYGELPRTYFFNAQHARSAVSGVLDMQAFSEKMASIMMPLKVQ